MNQLNEDGLARHLPGLSEDQKAGIKAGDKIEVCKEMREGWSGELPFFIFWCEDCNDFSYDYPHGHPENRRLNCHRCRASIDFRPWWAELAETWNMIRFGLSVRFRRK